MIAISLLKPFLNKTIARFILFSSQISTQVDKLRLRIESRSATRVDLIVTEFFDVDSRICELSSSCDSMKIRFSIPFQRVSDLSILLNELGGL